MKKARIQFADNVGPDQLVHSPAVWSEHSLFIDIYYSIHWLCKWTTKALISLPLCAGWSGPALYTNCIRVIFVLYASLEAASHEYSQDMFSCRKCLFYKHTSDSLRKCTFGHATQQRLHSACILAKSDWSWLVRSLAALWIANNPHMHIPSYNRCIYINSFLISPQYIHSSTH